MRDAKAETVEPPEPYREFVRRYPDVGAAYERLGEAVRAAGPLSAREIAIVKLAVSVGARMEGSTHAHTRKARASGVEDEALEQVALLACPTIGFPNMMATLSWIRDVLEQDGG